MTMPPSPVPSAFVSPAAIFERSIRRLASYPLAPYVVWKSTWQFSESVPGASNQAYNVTLRYAMRTSDKMETYSNYPIGTFLPNASVVVSWNGPFAWELRPKTAAQRDARVPDMPSELKTIATVVVSHPDYAIDLAGIDQIDGHRAYHLRLRPLADAVRHNLRELWVDVASFDLWKAVYVATPPAGGPTEITSSFNPVLDYWIETRRSWGTSSMSGPGSVEIMLDAVVFVPDLPNWLFDPRAYRRHQDAKDPDYLGTLLKPDSPAPTSSAP